MPAVILDEAFFKGWQDDALQRARRVLRREGKLRPTVIACVSPDLVDPSVIANCKPFDNSMEWSSATPESLALIYLSGMLDYEMGLQCIQRCMPPEGRAMLELLRLAAPGNAAKHLCAAYCSMRGIHEKDLFAMVLKDFFKRTQALAYLKVDESWVLHADADRKDYPDNLENVKEAKETLTVFMETKQFSRIVQLPFERTVRNTGRIASFGTADSTSFDRMEGRFTNLLQRDADLPREARS